MAGYDLFNLDDPEAAESIAEIRAAFDPEKKKIFVIGAGVSKSAGVSTFADRHTILRKSGGKSLLSENAFRTKHGTIQYLRVLESMLEEIAHASPSPFHWMLDGLAKRGDDIRVYTQNIDGLEFRCPRLSRRNVIPIHGQIHIMACPVDGYQEAMDITRFQKGQCPDCPTCPTRPVAQNPGRSREQLPRLGSRRNGKLKPYILLYDSEPETWPDLDFTSVLYEDTRLHPADTIVFAGTNLEVIGATNLGSDLIAAAPGATSLWLNIKDIPKKLPSSMFDFAIKATCDQFAHFIDPRL